MRLSRQEDHNSHFCAAPKHSQCCPAGSPKSMSYSCMPDHQPPCFEPPAILGSMYERKVEIGKTSKARLSCLNLVSSAPFGTVTCYFRKMQVSHSVISAVLCSYLRYSLMSQRTQDLYIYALDSFPFSPLFNEKQYLNKREN